MDDRLTRLHGAIPRLRALRWNTQQLSLDDHGFVLSSRVASLRSPARPYFMVVVRVICWVAAGAFSIFGLEFQHHVSSTRWGVKTLADGFIPSDAATPTTIAEQCALREPVVNGGSG